MNSYRKSTWTFAGGHTMKRKAVSFGIILFFLIMLLCPQEVFFGASKGLLLWFQTVLPTLLPFMILSGLLISTNSISYLDRVFGPLFRKLFRTSESASFAIIAGFLCGYPMGAKVTADLLRQGRISKAEGQYLLSFCNNTSPMFIISYVVWQNFQKESLMVPSLFLLFLTPVLSSAVFYPFYHKKSYASLPENSVTDSTKKQAPRICINFQMLDTCIMNSFETITKVGGYIILFSILISLLSSAPLQNIPFLNVALPFLEITNGIPMLCASDIPFGMRFILTLSLTAFGGVCSIAQTNCMLEGTGLSIFPYFLQKLITAVLCGMLAALFFLLFLHP